jgi:hypothetical protein
LVGNWLGTFTALCFIDPAKLGWSAKYGYILFGSNMIVPIFTVFFLPETRDRTLEEIHEMFEAKVKLKEFKGYVCTGCEAYAEQVRAKWEVIVGEKESGVVEHVEESGMRLRK